MHTHSLPRPAIVTRLVATALAALGVQSADAQPSAADSVTAFVNVTVIPMDRERTLPAHTVVVRGDRIVAVGPSARTPVPAGARRVDGAGKYLMPGLAEMHAHVPGGGTSAETVRDIMFLYIANGVTTIRGMLGAPSQLELRAQLARGEVLGPTLYVGAPSLNGNSAPDPATAERLVRAHKAAGYDLKKLHPGLTVPVWDATVRTAREVGITLAGHVSADVGIERALAGRQATIDHLDGYVEGMAADSIQARVRAGQIGLANRATAEQLTIGELVRAADNRRLARLVSETKRQGVWNVPTVYLWENFFNPTAPESLAVLPEMRYVSPAQVNGWVMQKRNRTAQDRQNGVTLEDARGYLALRRRVLRSLSDSGARLLMGTDSPQMFNVPGFALHREVALMADAGVPTYRVLESGTRNVAEYARTDLELPGDFGTVAVGNRADLVLLDANPLAGVSNLARRAGVMVRGRWVPAEEIERGLATLAAKHAR
jgi:imidazolonepropionase-like amidohydrolase